MGTFTMKERKNIIKGVMFKVDYDTLEAKRLGMSLREYKAIKDGYIHTYSIVTETFELGYELPKRRKKVK